MITSDLAMIMAEAALTGPYRQIESMTTDKFRKWLWDLEIKFMDWQTLHYLWINGVITPVAVAEQAIDEMPGSARERFVPTVSHEGEQLFGDLGKKKVELPALEVGREDFPGLEKSLWWHPFQLYEFYRIEWLIRQNWTLDSYLRNVDEGSPEWTNSYRDGNRKSLALEVEKPEHTKFRRLLALLLTIEPCVHGYIHGSIKYGVGDSLEEYFQWREELLSQDVLGHVGLTLEEAVLWHEKMSIRAHLQDPLRGIRTLVNQVDPKRRAKTKGRVLRANIMYSHAESLRRYLEWSHGQTLFEEDDYQMREGNQRVKESHFGSKRVMDGDRKVLRRIVRSYGIDHSERVALLLEGPTEVAFFEAVAKHWKIDLANRGIVLYDLKGKDGLDKNQVLKQLLMTFQKHEIFAYAAFDEDGGGDHIRTLNLMASRGVLSAGFSVWTPDFESHNFSLNELAQAATNLAQDDGMDVEFTAEEIDSYMRERNVPAGTAIERIASRKQVSVGKGAKWGCALAHVVCAEDVVVPEDVRNEEGDRPAFTMLSMLIRGHDADYELSVEHTIAQHTPGS